MRAPIPKGETFIVDRSLLAREISVHTPGLSEAGAVQIVDIIVWTRREIAELGPVIRSAVQAVPKAVIVARGGGDARAA